MVGGATGLAIGAATGSVVGCGVGFVDGLTKGCLVHPAWGAVKGTAGGAVGGGILGTAAGGAAGFLAGAYPTHKLAQAVVEPSIRHLERSGRLNTKDKANIQRTVARIDRIGDAKKQLNKKYRRGN